MDVDVNAGWHRRLGHLRGLVREAWPGPWHRGAVARGAWPELRAALDLAGHPWVRVPLEVQGPWQFYAVFASADLPGARACQEVTAARASLAITALGLERGRAGLVLSENLEDCLAALDRGDSLAGLIPTPRQAQQGG
jgi:hypothetical protein